MNIRFCRPENGTPVINTAARWLLDTPGGGWPTLFFKLFIRFAVAIVSICTTYSALSIRDNNFSMCRFNTTGW